MAHCVVILVARGRAVGVPTPPNSIRHCRPKETTANLREEKVERWLTKVGHVGFHRPCSRRSRRTPRIHSTPVFVVCVRATDGHGKRGARVPLVEWTFDSLDPAKPLSFLVPSRGLQSLECFVGSRHVASQGLQISAIR